MKRFPRTFYNRKRWLAFSVMMIVALLFMSLHVGDNVSANHPVLVEGNCDSPIPGTTIVPAAPGNGGSTSGGICGDYDGDGRIGTAEDTDGADRIFGTINAALGPGTGAAAGTGANMNGSVTIVASGRFPEIVLIYPGANGSTGFGNVTLQAAPGVSAEINAILQGDQAGGNVQRTEGVGITVGAGYDRKITLRNLTIRNWDTGVLLTSGARVTMDNCRLENNLNYGIRLLEDARVTGNNLRIASTGFRTGIGRSDATVGHAISFEDSSAGTIFHSQITGNFRAAISNTSSRGIGAVRYYEVFRSHNQTAPVIGPVPPDIVNATRENAP